MFTVISSLVKFKLNLLFCQGVKSLMINSFSLVLIFLFSNCYFCQLLPFISFHFSLIFSLQFSILTFFLTVVTFLFCVNQCSQFSFSKVNHFSVFLYFQGYVKVTVMVLGPGDEAPVSFITA